MENHTVRSVNGGKNSPLTNMNVLGEEDLKTVIITQLHIMGESKMKNFLVGKKTFLVMGVALVVALFQHFVAPIPAVDPDLWAIAVPVVGIILRFVTHQPVSF